MKMASVQNLEQWRDVARRFLGSGIPPEQIVWQAKDTGQQSLFGDDIPDQAQDSVLKIKPEFLSLIKRVACHRDEEKWALLYSALWRIQQGDRFLPAKSTDPLIHRLRRMDGEVRRDAHKTKAFVRFRQATMGDDQHYVAWHRPDHYILPLVAPFFQRRFSVMKWSILTPDQSVVWDGARLVYGDGVADAETEGDDIEKLWLTYYRSTFNPARIKIKMMKREMPVRHWPTLPETALIPQLLAHAASRVDAMVASREGPAITAEHYLSQDRSYENLKAAALLCRACPWACDATQTVFGEGALDASIMLIGEAPADQEDVAGQAFIGPAGQVLNDILRQASLDRASLYLTNTVKHFKFTLRNERRLNENPDARDINNCKPWLFSEIRLIKPKVIVTLGVTAARALVHQGFSLKHDGSRDHQFEGIRVIPTWHPSAVLRTPQPDAKEAIRAHILAALAKAAALLH